MVWVGGTLRIIPQLSLGTRLPSLPSLRPLCSIPRPPAALWVSHSPGQDPLGVGQGSRLEFGSSSPHNVDIVSGNLHPEGLRTIPDQAGNYVLLQNVAKSFLSLGNVTSLEFNQPKRPMGAGLPRRVHFVHSV